MSSTDHTFSDLRERARRVMARKRSGDAILSQLRDGPKYVSLAALSSMFKGAGLDWNEQERECIIRKFADNRRRIDWRRMTRALEIGPPRDYVDPDRCFTDSLPQPYRFIVRILDDEIVDLAWTQIVAYHPELGTSPADKARAAIELDLRRSCPPAVWLVSSSAEASESLPDPEAGIRTAAEEARTEEPLAEGICKAGQQQRSREVSGDEKTEEESHANREPPSDRLQDGEVSVVRWDNKGEFLFIGTSDGRVSLRDARRPEDTASCLALFPGAEGPPVTYLSEPVMIAHGEFVSLRIAAATSEKIPSINKITPREGGEGLSEEATGEQEVAEQRESEAGMRAKATPSRVSVLEVALPLDETFGDADGGFVEQVDTQALTLRSVCFADLPKQAGGATECALSPDGLRLATALSDGSLAVWVLPRRLSSAILTPTSTNPEAGDEWDGCRDTEGTENNGRPNMSESTEDAVCTDTVDRDADVGGAASRAKGETSVQQLGRPEMFIPHLISPAEKAYKKALLDYELQVQNRDAQMEHPVPGEQQPLDLVAPLPPVLAGKVAYHAAHVVLLPARRGPREVVAGDGSGGLAVWRSQSNVWRLYRLPPVADEDSSKTRDMDTQKDGAGADGGLPAGRGVNPPASGEDKDDNDPVLNELEPLTSASSLPSSVWTVPAPVTSCAVSRGSKAPSMLGNDTDDASTTSARPSLVAIGTEDGRVYVCDADLGIRRQGMSRHRGRITSLAFHRTRFLISGSNDEMIHIHDIMTSTIFPSLPSGGDGSISPLRCLHDARGYGIVRVACLEDFPLVFVEDTSERIVVYDLISGTILGVLGLDGRGGGLQDSSRALNSCLTNDSGGTSSTGGGGCKGTDAGREEKRTLVWGTGSGTVAVVTSKDGPHAHKEVGIWSPADLMWGLCPGIRAAFGHKRPVTDSDIEETYFKLGPLERKGYGHQTQRVDHATTAAPPGTDDGQGEEEPLVTREGSSRRSPPSPPPLRSAARGGDDGGHRYRAFSRDHDDSKKNPKAASTIHLPHGGRQGIRRENPASSKPQKNHHSADDTTMLSNSTPGVSPHHQQKSSLRPSVQKKPINNKNNKPSLQNEGNMPPFFCGRLDGATHHHTTTTISGGEVATPHVAWGKEAVELPEEIGAARRVKLYMQTRQAQRGAREARLARATWSVLQAL